MSKLTKYGLPIVLGLSAIWIVQEKGWDFFFTYYLPALTTLSAAFFGAYFAIQFQRDKEKDDIKGFNVANGNLAMFNIISMAKNLKDFQQQSIDPVRNVPFQYLQMLPTLHISNDDIKLEIDALHFLLEADDIKLLGELAREATRYQRTLDTINDRSRLHREEIQPKLEQAGIIQGASYTVAQIQGALGTRLYIQIETSTKIVVTLVDETIISLKKIADRLYISLKKQYPDKVIRKFG